MTWPLEYQHASVDFERFMVMARDAAGLQTTNMAWNMVEGVFHVFRKRLTVDQAIVFANVLPPVQRALFMDRWEPDAEPAKFLPRGEMTDEVRALRAAHNFSPPNAIEAVAIAVRATVDQAAFESVLAALPPAAREFWSLSPASPSAA